MGAVREAILKTKHSALILSSEIIFVSIEIPEQYHKSRCRTLDFLREEWNYII